MTPAVDDPTDVGLVLGTGEQIHGEDEQGIQGWPRIARVVKVVSDRDTVHLQMVQAVSTMIERVVGVGEVGAVVPDKRGDEA